MLKWNAKIPAMLVFCLLVAVALVLGEAGWAFSNFTW
jgi:hypothetical protein